MLQQPMKEKLHALRLHGMIEGIHRQEQDEAARELSFLDRLALLIDPQWEWRENQAGLISECVESMTAGCASARSGQFQVVFTKPVLGDGSWRRLVDITSHYDLGFVVVLVTSNFDFDLSAAALEDGVFAVLDVSHELPKTAEAARRAMFAAYLKGAGPCPEVASHPMAA